MPIDTSVPDSPGWWMDRCRKKLESRQKRLTLLDAHLRGDPPPPEGLKKLRPIYADFVKISRVNLAILVAEAPRKRMQVVGVRTAADADEGGDEAAWALWRRCGLKASSADVHRKMTGLGDGYVIVGYDAQRERPVVTAEDPRQVVTIHDPRDQRYVRAALKLFRDEELETDFAYLYRPGQVFVARRSTRRSGSRVASFDARSWEWDEVLSKPLPRGFEDVMPVVRFRNLDGEAEFERHLDTLNRINALILRRMVVLTFQAFKQRAISGDFEETDAQGQPIDFNDQLEADPGGLWLLPPDAKIWEGGNVDLNPLLTAEDRDLKTLAAATGTPVAMFAPETQSAEGASWQREDLVFRTEDRRDRAGDGWAQVQSLMHRFSGDNTRADVDAIEPIWAPIERYSLAEMGSAWAQFNGLPFQTRLRKVFRESPDEIARIMTERQGDIFDQLVAQVGQPASTPAAA